MDIERLKNDVIVFDIDGVLVKYDFPALNRKCWSANEWIRLNLKTNPYKSVNRIKLFDSLIKSKKPEDMFVLGTALSSLEQANKLAYLKDNYSKIPHDQVYFVGEDKYKVDVLLAMREAIDGIGGQSKKIIMIEDSPSIMMSIEGLKRPNIKCLMISDFVI